MPFWGNNGKGSISQVTADLPGIPNKAKFSDSLLLLFKDKMIPWGYNPTKICIQEFKYKI